MGFMKKFGQAFSGIFGKKKPRPKEGPKNKENNGSLPVRDEARSVPLKKITFKTVPQFAEEKKAKTPSLPPPESLETADTSRNTTAILDSRFLQEGAVLAKALQDGDFELLNASLEKIGQTAHTLTSSGALRAKKALATSAELQQMIEDKKGPVTGLSSLLCRETAALTDEAMRLAAKWLALSKKLLHAAEIMDQQAAEEYAAEIITQAVRLDATLQAKSQSLSTCGQSFDKWIQGKDFFALSNHAEGLARDATLLAIMASDEPENEPLDIPDNRLDFIQDLSKRIQAGLAEKRYSEVAALASLLSAHCGLLSDSNLPKAAGILSQATKLKENLLKGAFTEEAIVAIQRHGSVFSGAMLDRQKRAKETMPLLKQATFTKDISALAAAANKLWRSLTFFNDSDFKRANGIAAHSFKLDGFIKAKDREKALAILDKFF